ncbi:xylose isomerase [Mucilaginibacter limnophilus]|uniref:Xylose isomerase n=1 Tax=Mucilaginibacter limnophilus TaxID=1932778 RepID=A0A437MRS0_9SPHI|nr:metabolite traffic protein EboE [Mucilaginibacter limnophilus]RVU00351.1 xylose isomerase [Mucilaginibacter limnophilus]
MKLSAGHLTYCTNIHAGEDWSSHFAALKQNFPEIKKELSPDAPMGIGLRLSNIASVEILLGDNMAEFKQWLQKNNAYVFTMNGFPYGGFHHTVVKDQVHAPDWTTDDRLAYTIRLFHILAALLPEGMEGGISTSPLSYRHWFDTEEKLAEAKVTATKHILAVAEELYLLNKQTGIYMHLDIEPEPDGILETGREFIDWFEQDLLPRGIIHFTEKLKLTIAEAEELIKQHITLCFDVCHFAIGYERYAEVLNELQQKGIKVGKIQVSAALKATFSNDNSEAVLNEFAKFNEPIYLHQVIAKVDGELLRYSDLPDALSAVDEAEEWRAHFHVPVFLENFGLLQSTQSDIVEVLSIQKSNTFTSHLEVETYTWGVLPNEDKLPIAQSISRELAWVKNELTN